MSARPGGGGGSGKVQGRGFRVWVHLFDGGCAGPGGVHLCRRVSAANTAVSRVGGERSSLGGVKDHERSEYRTILERQEFVVRNGAGALCGSGKEDDNL